MDRVLAEGERVRKDDAEDRRARGPSNFCHGSRDVLTRRRLTQKAKYQSLLYSGRIENGEVLNVCHLG